MYRQTRYKIPYQIFTDRYDEIKDIVFNKLIKPRYGKKEGVDVVYRIQFNDGKSYIGQSTNYYNNRLHLHLLLLNGSRSVKYSGKKINEAIRTQGVSYIEILFKLEQWQKNRDKIDINDSITMLTEKERYYITAYDTITNGYNSRM